MIPQDIQPWRCRPAGIDWPAALLYAVSVGVLVGLGEAFAGGGLTARAAELALGAGAFTAAASAWAAARRPRAEGPVAVPPGPWEWAAIALFTLASARVFLWLVFSDGDKVKVLSPNNLGDLSLHLTYINYLAGGVPFWPENPILAHTPLTYPLGIDLFNSLLTLAGLDVWRGLIWVGLGGAALTGAALWRWGRGVALLALLANGGLAGLLIFTQWRLQDFQAELAWKNVFLAIFATQRGMLFALPAGLLLLASWRDRFLYTGPGSARLPFYGELLLYAAMPVFHLHTFLFLSLLLGVWLTLRSPLQRHLARLAGAAFIPATGLVLLVTGMMKGAHVIGWKPGWMWDDEVWLKWCGEHLPGPPEVCAMLLFWPVNLGFLLGLVAWLGWRLTRGSEGPWQRALFWPALGIFVLCCFIKFAPWEWDNTKIMIWSYLTILPMAWAALLATRPLWQRAAALVLLFGSGFLSLLGGIDGKFTGFDIAQHSHLDGVAKAAAGLPPTACFAGYPTYNHPLLLIGRRLALGYTGHVHSHGLAWEQPLASVESLLNGAPGWREAARELGVRYLFWGPEEEEHYPASAKPWLESSQLLSSGEWGELFDLGQAAAPPPGDEPRQPAAPGQNALRRAQSPAVAQRN